MIWALPRPAGFNIRLNHRGILRGLMEVAGVPATLEGAALVAIDKLDKVGMEGVRAELDDRGIPPQAAAHLLESMAAAPTDNAAMLDWLEQLLASSKVGSAGVADLRTVVAYSAYGPAADRLCIDAYLTARPLLHTGPIFEIEFPGLSGSGGGGGRYDQLIGMFSGQHIPSCGFSLGLERIMLLMEEGRAMFPYNSWASRNCSSLGLMRRVRPRAWRWRTSSTQRGCAPISTPKRIATASSSSMARSGACAMRCC